MKSKILHYTIGIILLLLPHYTFAGMTCTDPVDSNYRYYSREFGGGHKGIDIVGKCKGLIKGQNAYAVADGKVVAARLGTDYGKVVMIDHENGYITVYAHLESFNVKSGDTVTSGQVIGKIGATGSAWFKKAYHLHFEIREYQPGADVDSYSDVIINATPRSPFGNCLNKDNYKKQACTGGGPIPQVGPGGDQPDDTFSVADTTFPTTPTDLENAYYRLAVKNGKTIVINYYKFKRLIKERDAYLENLPDGVVPDQNYLDSIDAEISQLYESFGADQELFWQEYETVPGVAVLQNGYSDSSIALLNKFFEPALEVPISFSPTDSKNQPILIIPSGGLYGMENSSFFKASLDEYVKQGGTLIVFAQQHGYEFSVLPVPQEADGTYRTITGYGWTEDQSCFTNAAYIDTYHQILSGQSKSTPTLNIDGYFTNYPSNSTVLLRRTANGQPAMLMYDYGFGKVIVTSMYSDFAYSHSQTSLEEKALVRDMISWANKQNDFDSVMYLIEV